MAAPRPSSALRVLALLGFIGSGLVTGMQLLGPAGPLLFLALVGALFIPAVLLERRRVADYRRRSGGDTALFRAHSQDSSPFDIEIDRSGLRLRTRVLPQRYAWSDVTAHEISRNRFRRSGAAEVRLALKDGYTERFKVEDPDRFEAALHYRGP